MVYFFSGRKDNAFPLNAKRFRGKISLFILLFSDIRSVSAIFAA